MRKYTYLFSIILFGNAPAFAQEQSFGPVPVLACSGGEDPDCGVIGAYRSASENSITVTATGLASDIAQTGQAVTVIGEEEIESVQGGDLMRVLRRAPGVTFTRNGGPGGFTGMRVRGATAEQLLVLLDGVRVADPGAPAGGFDFGNVLAGNVAKLDLLRSSNSTIWGADAIGGVLAISTREDRGVAASAEYGSDDTAYLTASGGTGGDGYFLGGSGSWYRTDGFSSAAIGTEPDGFQQWAANLRGRASLTDGVELFASGRLASGDLDIDGYPPPLYAFADTAETQETRQYSGAAGVNFGGEALFVTASYSFADTERKSFDPSFGSAATYTTDGHSDRAGLRGEWRATGPFVLNFGGEAEWTRFSSLFDAPQSTRILGAYLQAGIETERLAAHAGVRQDDHALFGSATSFGADLSYELAEDLRLRASFGEGFKPPSLFQLLSDYGNESLKPERSDSYDLGLAWHTRADPAYAALTVFRRDSRDLIDFVSCFGVTGGICTDRPFGTYDNVGRARAEGVEAEFGLAPVETLHLRAVYSYVRARDRDLGTDLARRPRDAFTASADWTSPFSLALGGDLRVVGDGFDDAANLVPLEGYALVDLRASIPLDDTVELFGRIENLTDKDYVEVAGYGTPGRGVHVGARAAF